MIHTHIFPHVLFAPLYTDARWNWLFAMPQKVRRMDSNGLPCCKLHRTKPRKRDSSSWLTPGMVNKKEQESLHSGCFKLLRIIQRPPGPIQRDAIQLCKGQRQFGYEQATKCIEVARNGKYWSYFNLKFKKIKTNRKKKNKIKKKIFFHNFFWPIFCFQYYFRRGQGTLLRNDLVPHLTTKKKIFFS